MASVDKLPMLAEGYERLTAELKALREDRPKIIDAIEEARAHGDLSENAENSAAREEQAKMEGRIVEIEAQIENAKVINTSELSKDTVSIGSIVEIAVAGGTLPKEDLDEIKEEIKGEYTMVGGTEANLLEKKLSDQSLLGKALIGQKLGSNVVITTPAGNYTVKIKKIRLPE